VILISLFTTMALVPLFFVDALPTQQLLTTLIAPPPPPPPPPPAPASAPQAARAAVAHSEVLTNSRLQAPSVIPQRIAMVKEDVRPESSSGGVVGGVPGGVLGGQLGGIIGGIISSTPNVAAIPKLAPPAPVKKAIRISQGVSQGLLIYQPSPEYPRIARAARIQGQVLLKAVISRDGRIEDLQAISGHPMLIPPAIRAVQQWRYRPYLLNGEPVEVETEITVNFLLSQN
jgi:protein TonB